jgi:hypothetical protein
MASRSSKARSRGDLPVEQPTKFRPRRTRACWICGRDVAPMRFRASDLSPARVGAAAHDPYIVQHLIAVVLGQV